jgi:hypothetical protein
VPAVASALGISVEAVHQRLSRGRQLVATEVAELVEYTLERRRTRRNLAVAVLAALPIAVAPSHANAANANASGGTSMLKLGIAASVIGLGLAGAGYAVHRSSASGTPAATATTPAGSRTVRGAANAGAPGSLVTRASTSAPKPPALPAVAAMATHYDCAAASAHLSQLASTLAQGQHDVTMTPDQLAAMRAAFGSNGTFIMVDENGEIGDGSGLGSAVIIPVGPDTLGAHVGGGGSAIAIASVGAQVGNSAEQQCVAEHWSQALIDCLATAGDLWTDVPRCGAENAPDGPSAAAIAAVTDASCTAVGAHVASLVAPTLPALDPNDVPAVVIAEMNSVLANVSPQIEATCTNSGWNEATRRCLVAMTSPDQLEACLATAGPT